jgi:hypothetical protein
MAKTSSNPRDRFALAAPEAKQRLIARSAGEVGTGKTSFWLGAPGPILVQSLDKGLEGVVEKVMRDTGKEIRVAEYDWTPTEDLSQDEAIELRDRLIEDFEFAIQNFRTVIWDKETNIWELFRYAEFGEPNDAPRNYPKLNQRYRKYVNMPKATGINFGCIQSLKDHWISKAKKDGSGMQGFNTGERIPQGFSELDELVHIDLFHRYENGTFYLDVGKSRGPGGQDVQGQTFENLTFTEFAMLVFPDTTEEDWQ